MSTEIFEDEISLEVGTLEAIPPSSERPGACYPYPELRATGRVASMTFRTVVLENSYLRVTVVPDLGGRILKFFDKRTNTEVLPSFGVYQPVEGGPRGVELQAGILLDIGQAGRMNAMGPVEFQIQDYVDEDEVPYLLMHELIGGIGVSWHATMMLPPDRAELHLGIKTQNRQLVPAVCRQGLKVWFEPGSQSFTQANSSALYAQERAVGLSLHYSDQLFEQALGDDAGLSIWRSADQDVLIPRQSDSWNVVLQPISKMPSLEGWSSESALSLKDGKLTVQAITSRSDCKVVVENKDGQNFEAPLDLYPEKPAVLDVSSMPDLSGVAVRDLDKDDLLLRDLTQPLEILAHKGLGLSDPSTVTHAIGHPDRDSREYLALQGMRDGSADKLAAGLNIPGLQSASRIGLALACLRQKQFDEALVWLEDAVSFNAEDHLLWWLKAMVKRMHGREEEEDQDLPTSHFLAPLEPALRAESFLKQEQTHGKDPSPIIKPLGNHPEAMIEVACLLLDAGLDEEAMRWMDEARRHRDESMLRYLQAWSLLSKTRMDVEAAELVRGVSSRPIEPPYPWREIERRALKTLGERFHDDQRLGELSKLANGQSSIE